MEENTPPVHKGFQKQIKKEPSEAPAKPKGPVNRDYSSPMAKKWPALLKAIDRKAFAVHYDPVNMIWSPMRYYQTGEIIREFVAKLGPHIRSVHAKDIHLTDQLTVHLGEVVPGKGNLDYRTLLRELAKLDPDTPVMLEHLAGEPDYKQAAEHLRGVAKDVGVTL